jgi:hypothetical protein
MLRLMNHWGAMPENTNQKEFSYKLSIFKGAKYFKRDDEQSNNKVNYVCCEIQAQQNLPCKQTKSHLPFCTWHPEGFTYQVPGNYYALLKNPPVMHFQA